MTALDGLRDEPGGRIGTDSALQGDRRAPSTVATGDESPMNSRERRVQRALQKPGRHCLLRATPWANRRGRDPTTVKRENASA